MLADFLGLEHGGELFLLAGHIKPWKDSTSAELLDTRNGLAAAAGPQVP